MSSLAKIDGEMNYILSLIQHIQKSSKISLRKNRRLSSENNKNNSRLILEDNSNDLITSENFPFSHLCNRDIRDLPLSQGNSIDFDRLRSCCILTMTDLIGRYLIHKTPEEFRTFLIEKIQCSQSFTDEIIQLIQKWTLNNLLIGRGTRTTTFKQYL